MSDGKDKQSPCRKCIDKTVREAPRGNRADAAGPRATELWIGGQRVGKPLDFIEEARSEPWCLGFVELGGFSEFEIG